MNPRAAQNGQPEPAGNGKLWHRTVWAEAVWSSGLPTVETVILLCYADHARDGDTAWVTLERLEERTRTGRRALIKHRQALVTAGWLVEVRAADHRNAAVYRMAVPEPSSPISQDMSESSQSDESTHGGALDAPLGCTTDTPGVHLSHVRGARRAPNPSTNPSTQPQYSTPGQNLRAHSSVASLLTSGRVRADIPKTNDQGTDGSDERPEHPSPSVAVLKDAGNDEERGDSPTVVGSPLVVGRSPEAEEWADGERQSMNAGRRHRKRPPPEREETCCCRVCGCVLPVERCAAGCCERHAS